MASRASSLPALRSAGRASRRRTYPHKRVAGGAAHRPAAAAAVRSRAGGWARRRLEAHRSPRPDGTGRRVVYASASAAREHLWLCGDGVALWDVPLGRLLVEAAAAVGAGGPVVVLVRARQRRWERQAGGLRGLHLPASLERRLEGSVVALPLWHLVGWHRAVAATPSRTTTGRRRAAAAAPAAIPAAGSFPVAGARGGGRADSGGGRAISDSGAREGRLAARPAGGNGRAAKLAGSAALQPLPRRVPHLAGL
mmetsp:Transcript_5444/g.18093  ORF Transcript_5444/g.18093 Transcript_5444/m.18093 type:complete len:253 (-) Transcript_5444:1556-2314(-)